MLYVFNIDTVQDKSCLDNNFYADKNSFFSLLAASFFEHQITRTFFVDVGQTENRFECSFVKHG